MGMSGVPCRAMLEEVEGWDHSAGAVPLCRHSSSASGQVFRGGGRAVELAIMFPTARPRSRATDSGVSPVPPYALAEDSVSAGSIGQLYPGNEARTPALPMPGTKTLL